VAVGALTGGGARDWRNASISEASQRSFPGIESGIGSFPCFFNLYTLLLDERRSAASSPTKIIFCSIMISFFRSATEYKRLRRYDFDLTRDHRMIKFRWQSQRLPSNKAALYKSDVYG
jgi:hypothetical protein